MSFKLRLRINGEWQPKVFKHQFGPFTNPIFKHSDPLTHPVHRRKSDNGPGLFVGRFDGQAMGNASAVADWAIKKLESVKTPA